MKMMNKWGKADDIEKWQIIQRYIYHSKMCWMCGMEGSITAINKKLSRHHVIPLRLRPQHNLLIPLCESCHNIMHGEHGLMRLEAVISRMKEMSGNLESEIKILKNISEKIDGGKTNGI